MQIVIEIPDEDYNQLDFLLENHACSIAYFDKIIKNGKPLQTVLDEIKESEGSNG